MKITSETKNKILTVIKKNRYIFAVILAGMLIMMLPTRGTSAGKQKDTAEDIVFSVETEETRLQRVISKIEGVGDVTVMLAVKSDGRTVTAVNSEESLDGTTASKKSQPVVLENDGSEGLAVIETIRPEYSGAVVVAEGAENAAVRLKITEAVKAATGLGSDKITVIN